MANPAAPKTAEDEKPSKQQPPIGYVDFRAKRGRTGYRDRAVEQPYVDSFGADDYSEEGYA